MAEVAIVGLGFVGGAMFKSFTEKGADSLNLNVSNQTYHIGNIGLSETLSWDIENRLGNYSPFISVDFNLQKYLNKPTANQKFVGQNNFKTTIGKETIFTSAVNSGIIFNGKNSSLSLLAGYSKTAHSEDVSGSMTYKLTW